MELLFKILKIVAFVVISGWLGTLLLRAARAGPFLKRRMNEERYDALAGIVGGVALCLSLIGLVYLTAWFADVL